MRALLFMFCLWAGLFAMLAPVYTRIEQVRAEMVERLRQLERSMDEEQTRITVLEMRSGQ